MTHCFTTSNSCIITTLTAVAKNFDTFIAEWSGLNTLLQTAKTEVAKATGIPYNEMISKPKIESDNTTASPVSNRTDFYPKTATIAA